MNPTGGQTWVPDLPLGQWTPEDLEYAQRLHRALAPAWSRFGDPSMAQSEVEGLGCADYRREFGHAISPRHWRRLVAMVRARGGGRGADLDPLAVYQPKRLNRAVAGALPDVGRIAAASPEMEPLVSAIHGVNDIRNPSPDERAFLWGRAFEHFEAGIASGKPRLAWKRAIIGWLHGNVGSLAGTLPSLRRLWDVKHPLWLKAEKDPSALRDKRAVEKKKRLPKADILAIQAQTVLGCGGRTAQGFREARALGLLSAETAARFTDSPSRRSYVPDAVRREVQPMLRALANHVRGTRTAKLKGPWVGIDYSNVCSGDLFTADDLTPPNYFEDDFGLPVRGQFLAFQDVRSRKILKAKLVLAKNYDSCNIRSLMSRVCREYGLPRVGFIFEGGIWENSPTVNGRRKITGVSKAEVESGLAALGVKFTHTRSPRGKGAIERTFGILQNQMEGLPGYCGRNEMIDKYERLQARLVAIRKGKRSPQECGLMSVTQWVAVMASICEEFNATPMESEATQGMSPNDAWKAFHAEGRRIFFPPEAAYLLYPDQTEVDVDLRNSIRVGPGRKFRYLSDELGALVGQTVLAWFNPEEPEFCCVTDLQRRNAITVPIEVKTPPPGMANPEEKRAALRKVAEFGRPVRSRYVELKQVYVPKFAKVIVAESVKRLGSQMHEQKEAMRAAQREAASLRASVRSATGNLAPDLADPLAQSLARDPARAKSAIELQRLLDSEPAS